MNLTIHGQVIAKKNSKRLIQVHGRTIPISSKPFMVWHKVALIEAVAIRKEKKLGTYTQAEVEMTFYFSTKRKCDISNMAESIMDLLVDAEILLDDSWAVIPKITIIFGGTDKENPRAEITIKQLEKQL